MKGLNHLEAARLRNSGLNRANSYRAWKLKKELRDIFKKHKKEQLKRVRLTNLREQAIKYNEIVYFREVQQHTLEETGKKFGVTRERIRQITQANPKDDFLYFTN